MERRSFYSCSFYSCTVRQAHWHCASGATRADSSEGRLESSVGVTSAVDARDCRGSGWRLGGKPAWNVSRESPTAGGVGCVEDDTRVSVPFYCLRPLVENGEM